MQLVRLDGRQEHELRPLFIASGCIGSHSTTSACAEVGGSRVVCCLRGPQQLTSEARGHRGKVTCSVSRTPYATTKRQAPTMHNAMAQKDIELVMEGIAERIVCLETIPQIQFDLVFEIMSSETGNDLPALTGTMMSCLVSAGISVRDVAAAATVALMPHGRVIVDPSPSELLEASGVCTAVVATGTGECCYAHHSGNVDVTVGMDMLERALDAAMTRRRDVRAALEDDVRRE